MEEEVTMSEKLVDIQAFMMEHEEFSFRELFHVFSPLCLGFVFLHKGYRVLPGWFVLLLS